MNGHLIDLLLLLYKRRKLGKRSKEFFDLFRRQGFKLYKNTYYNKYLIDFVRENFSIEIFVKGNYEKLQRFCPDDKVVIDVGASNGDYSLMASITYGAKQVFAFEPDETLFEIMDKNIKLNEAENISTYNYGLHSINKLDDLHIDKVDLIKIDITKDKELEVLQGAKQTIKKFKPRIIIETPTEELKKEIIKFLSDYKVVLSTDEEVTVEGQQLATIYLEAK